jgi:adenosylcobyric acid synthase
VPERTVMFLGVAGQVGKTTLANAYCRLRRTRGGRVGFFKAMSVDREGLRTQDGGLVAAHLHNYQTSCATPLRQANNPCFYDETTSILYVMGDAVGKFPHVSADNVDFSDMSPLLLDRIRRAVIEQASRVASEMDCLILEGSGCCTDDARHDFCNGFVARSLAASVALVANGRKGGFAASLVGTFKLLPAAVRPLVRGFIVSQVDPGCAQVHSAFRRIEEETGMPCLACVPNLPIDSSTTYEQWMDMIIAHVGDCFAGQPLGWRAGQGSG